MPRERQDGARSLSCPSTQPHAFSFAPCLGPVLLFELAEKTSLGTCQEAYGSAWRDEWGEPPIRPKNMQRRTFKRLADELWDAWLRDASANFGVSLDRDALGNLGT